MAPTAIRSLTRLVGTAALVGLAVALLAAPASAKGPPSGKGGPPPSVKSGGGPGGGPPPWAGGAGKGHPAQKRTPAPPKASKAGKAREQVARKRAKHAERKDNPASTCFGLMIELGDAFAETFGTNENKANAFGRCVSEQAKQQARDSGEGDDAEEPADCEAPAEGDEPAEGGDGAVELAALDEDPPVGEGCEPVEDTGSDEGLEGTDETGGEEPAELTCFAQAASRANPFAVCVRA